MPIRILLNSTLRLLNSQTVVLKNLPAERSRLRSVLSRFGTLLEAIFIFILLLSGIGVVFIGKISGLLNAGLLLLTIGLSVQIGALVLLGIFLYIRFLRQERIVAE
jgi:hypothetical protein